MLLISRFCFVFAFISSKYLKLWVDRLTAYWTYIWYWWKFSWFEFKHKDWLIDWLIIDISYWPKAVMPCCNSGDRHIYIHNSNYMFVFPPFYIHGQFCVLIHIILKCYSHENLVEGSSCSLLGGRSSKENLSMSTSPVSAEAPELSSSQEVAGLPLLIFSPPLWLWRALGYIIYNPFLC